jgi:hypothetical protein
MSFALAILVVTIVLAQGAPSTPDPGTFERDADVTLRLEYASGSTCDLGVNVAPSQRKGWVGLSCDGRKASRMLTVSETNEFLDLARDSRLYSTRGVGRDGRAGDAWLATLTVTDAGFIVKLVVSGNPEFGRDPRRQLLQLLQQRLVELRSRLDTLRKR